jgi:anti-anti-sigma regulatory factor
VDVEALGFVDSASTGVLVEMRRKAVAKGGDLTFVRSTARFRRRLADMGLGDQFAFAASEEDALAALGRGRKGPTPPAPGSRPSSRG